MGENTGIGWTEKTWNPWYGCTKISPGCQNCYMYRDMERYGRDPFTVQRSKTTFNSPLKWKKSAMVFTCSWSDFFIEAADAWRPEAWDIIKRTPHLTYQLLTKRPELIVDRLPADWGEGYPNVWLGTSVESQHYGDLRIPLLLQTPAVVRFLSVEPMLEAVEFSGALMKGRRALIVQNGEPLRLDIANHAWGGKETIIGPLDTSIDWVIVGGESGSDRREFDPKWICDIVDQCRAAQVPVFVKQDSASKPGQQGRIPNQYWVHEFPVRTPNIALPTESHHLGDSMET